MYFFQTIYDSTFEYIRLLLYVVFVCLLACLVMSVCLFVSVCLKGCVQDIHDSAAHLLLVKHHAAGLHKIAAFYMYLVIALGSVSWAR